MKSDLAWAHVAHKDGMFAGVITANLGGRVASPHATATVVVQEWRHEVSKFCGDFIADGFTVTTVYSRDEYNELIEPMKPYISEDLEQNETP